MSCLVLLHDHGLVARREQPGEEARRFRRRRGQSVAQLLLVVKDRVRLNIGMGRFGHMGFRLARRPEELQVLLRLGGRV